MYDCIIIGSGLGGLTAGAKLAKAGKKILLLEQHDRVGGCATTFKRKDFTLEVGLHEMDGLHPRDMKSKIFRDLGILDRVNFLKVPEFYRFVNGRYDVVISHNPVEVSETLTKLFPADEEGIKLYFEFILDIRQKIKSSDIQSDITIGEFLDNIISDEDLKLILLGNLGYYDDDPYNLSLIYYCMAQNSYYTGGGNFIQGGSQVLSNALADIIRENGGEILLKHKVNKILTEDGLSTGIEYSKVSSEETLVAFGSEIIANASIPQVAESLLPEEFSDFKSEYTDLRPGASLLTVYFGFNKLPSELGHHNYSTFLYDPSVSGQKDILGNNQGSFETRSFTFVDYSQVDAQLAPKGKAVGAICAIDYTQDWANLSHEDYKKKKKEAEIIFRQRLNKLIPGIDEHIEYCEIGTATTVERYTLNPLGAVYGFAQSLKRSGKKIESPITNLHFASAWTQTGGGFSGAIFSGYLCAMDVIRKTR